MLLEETKDSLKRLMLQEFEKQIEERMDGDLHGNGACQERSDNSDSEAVTFIYIRYFVALIDYKYIPVASVPNCR
jgi:hypothetical protein